MNVALTGATGFVGSQLASALVSRGDSVTCLARSRAKAAQLSGCRALIGELEDARSLADLCSGAEVVFHVAGLTAARDEAEFLRVNRDGALRLAEAARAASVRRLVLVSSLAAAGPSAPGRPLEASVTPRPISPYGRSKLAGEAAVRASGVPFTIVRPPTVYGPRDRELLRVFKLARRGIVPLLGDGRQELSLIHVADLAEALIAAATSAASPGRLYHVAHPEIATQRGLALAIGRAVGRSVRALPISGHLVRAALHVSAASARLFGSATLLAPWKADELLAPAWTCVSDALVRDSSWSARVPLERGLAQTAGWYRENGWL